MCSKKLHTNTSKSKSDGESCILPELSHQKQADNTYVIHTHTEHKNHIASNICTEDDFQQVPSMRTSQY